MLKSQRIGRLSWDLAAAYLVCGLSLFVLSRKIALVLSALQPPLLLPTRLFLWVGPSGWLAFMLWFSALALVRNIAFRPHWLNPGITIALWVALCGAVVCIVCLALVVLFQPICVFGGTITAQ